MKVSKREEVTELVVVEEAGIDISLTFDEASKLLALIGKVYIDDPLCNLYYSLKNLQVPRKYSLLLNENNLEVGTIKFKQRDDFQ